MVDGILNRYIFTVFSYQFAILHRISVCLFHKVLQRFIFLQGLRVSKHSVFPVCKLRNTSSPKLLLAYWDPRDIGGALVSSEFSYSGGRLSSLRSERLPWPRLSSAAAPAALLQHEMVCRESLDPRKLCCAVLCWKATQSSFGIIAIKVILPAAVRARWAHP